MSINAIAKTTSDRYKDLISQNAVSQQDTDTALATLNARMTEVNAAQANVGRRFAIVLDNRIISAPAIREPILGGTASISGSFTVESASQLAISLRSGRLPVELHVVEERSIGPNIRPSGANAANN